MKKSKRIFIGGIVLFVLGIMVSIPFFKRLYFNHVQIASVENVNNIEMNQWYLKNTGIMPTVGNANCWMFDEQRTRAGVDINYQDYSKNCKNHCTVAIIDTGVNIYEDYYKNIWVNEDEIPNDNVDNDNNGYIDDIYGWNFCDNTNCLYTNPYVEEHGDIITSVLCSNNDGYISILGGTMCNIMIVQALDSSSATGEVSDVISAIKYAEENGATICNLSFSTYNASDELRKVMTESKMLFVVSAGNEGEELSRDYLTYPTGWELSNVISVGSVRCDGELSCESNYSSQYVDVLAPGADIVGYDNNGIICSESGTSMATALVTGLAAMVYSCSSENLSAIQIKKIICSNVKTNEKYRKLSKYNGIINYSKTLMNLN